MFRNLKILFSPLSRSQKRLLFSINTDDISVFNKVYTYYLLKVRNNEFDTKETCRKKLLRNIILGKNLGTEIFSTTYQYGNLLIKYNVLNNVITDIDNRKGYYHFDEKDVKYIKRKEWLNRFLDIK